MSDSESEAETDYFHSDADESQEQKFPLKAKATSFKPFKVNDEVSDEEELEESEEENVEKYTNEEESNENLEELPTGDEESSSNISHNSLVNKKLKKLTDKELEKEKKRLKKTGVCYLSKVPPYMKPSKLRSILTRFGTIDRLFLKPEDSSSYHKRKKYGGNKKKKFTEGWIEFVNKNDAKLCAITLNGSKLGGKKGSYYYDDIINIKYLKNFKWMDLTQQISRENEIREAKLALELSQQNKYNRAFVHNVEQAKLIKDIQKKRKGNENSENTNDKSSENELRRNFKQRKVESKLSESSKDFETNLASKSKLSTVLSKVL
ncbi:ESF2 [Candida pseudojiufengensis]|uniref:ESF2 n=1 Tax=Candida pseudojiufengensis TaxID=497109 RepID=UPI0022254417|nr:ESF2 [Candida pseudojiufengensis]KAI5964371.1 ESF2 [Candida pseudojiufengensis]